MIVALVVVIMVVIVSCVTSRIGSGGVTEFG